MKVLYRAYVLGDSLVMQEYEVVKETDRSWIIEERFAVFHKRRRVIGKEHRKQWASETPAKALDAWRHRARSRISILKRQLDQTRRALIETEAVDVEAQHPPRLGSLLMVKEWMPPFDIKFDNGSTINFESA